MTAGQGTVERAEDPELFTRWLTIEHLLTSARELDARGAGAWPSLALVSADGATEAMLGLLATAGPTPPPDRAKFEELYGAAIATLRELKSDLPLSLRTRLIASHRARNAAIHEGTGPAPATVGAAIKVAVELRGLIIGVLPTLRPFGTGGPVSAIAVIVDDEPISGPLAEADRLLTEGRLTEAADAAAMAFDATLASVQPPLRSPPGRSAFSRSFRGLFNRSRQFGSGYSSPFTDAERELDRTFDYLDRRVSHHEAWIVAGGLGLRPAELADLQHVLGSPIGVPGRREVHRSEDVTLTHERVESALLSVADLVYRAWQGGALVKTGRAVTIGES